MLPCADAADAEGDESAAAVAAVLSGAVAKIVYKNAIAAVPGNLPFCKRLLESLAAFEFPGVEALADQIYDSIAADFPQVSG